MLRWRLDGPAVLAFKTRDYPPSPVPKDSAWRPHWEDLPMMERNAQEDLKAHLIATNEEYRRLSGEHIEFAKKLDALESLPHLTEEEQLEETSFEKIKTAFERSDGSDRGSESSSTRRLEFGCAQSHSYRMPGWLPPTGLFSFVAMNPDPEPVRIPITDVFDLHTVPPRDVQGGRGGISDRGPHRGFSRHPHHSRPWHRRTARDCTGGTAANAVRRILLRCTRGGGRLGRHNRHPFVDLAALFGTHGQYPTGNP